MTTGTLVLIIICWQLSRLLTVADRLAPPSVYGDHWLDAWPPVDDDDEPAGVEPSC